MLGKKFIAILLVASFSAFSYSFAQNCTLSCNSAGIDIILDKNCERTIVLADVLSSSMDCNGPFLIELFDESNHLITSSPMLNGDYIGRTVTAKISDTASGNSCEVPLNIFDKQVPNLTCSDLSVKCNVDNTKVVVPKSFASSINQMIANGVENFDIPVSGFTNSISDVNIYLNVNLANATNGSISISSPTGTKVKLLSFSSAAGCATSSLKLNFDDHSVRNYSDLNTSCQSSNTISGSYKGEESLSAFNEKNPNGTWKIEVIVSGVGQVQVSEAKITISDDNLIFPFPTTGLITATEIGTNRFSINNFDACGAAILSYFDIINNENCGSNNNRVITRTWKVVDLQGNENSCVQTISLERLKPNEVDLPISFSVQNNNALSCDNRMPIPNGIQEKIGWNALANGHPAPEDVYYPAPNNNIVKWFGTGIPKVGGCYDLSFSYSDIKINQCTDQVNPNCFKINRTWTAIDPCTNQTFEYTQQIFVVDSLGPVITGIDNITISTEGFSCQTNYTVPIPTLSDNCSSTPSLTYNIFSPEGYVTFNNFNNQYTIRDLPVGDHSIRVQASDCCGNETNKTFSLSVRDQLVPSVVCESLLTTNLGSSGTSKVFAETFDEGSLDGCAPVFFKVIRMNDLLGTSIGAIQSQTTGKCNSKNSDDDATLTGEQIYFDDAVLFCCEDLNDNVQVVLRVFDVNPGAGPVHPDRMKSGGDLFGRFNDCMPQVSVNDKNPPTINCPADITLNCNQWYQDTSLTGVPIAYDNCSLTSVTFEDDVNLNQCQVGTVVRTWTATDHTNRTAVCKQVITMKDDTNPVITYPSDRTIDCADLNDLAIAGQPIVADNCALIGWNHSDVVFPIGGTCKLKVIRTWSGMDLCDWVAYSHKQTIIAEDNQPPILLNIPNDLTALCDDIPMPAVVVASDDCDNASTLVFKEDTISQTCTHTYILKRTWTAMDVCGNSVSGGHQISVQDTIAPVFDSIPQDMNLNCSDQAMLLPMTAMDNCDPNPNISHKDSILAGNCPNGYTILRTWTVVDDCGNKNEIFQNLIFSDNEDPVLMNVPNNITINCGDAIPAAPTVQVSDNCDNNLIAVLTETNGLNYCTDSIFLRRTWVATDSCGNSTSATQLIYLIDKDPPVFDALPANITISCTDDLPPTELTATDLCTPNIVVVFNLAIQFDPLCPQNQIRTRTWTATDACGNSATHSATISIVDDKAPFIEESIVDITLNCEQPIPSSMVTVKDNCDGNPQVVFSETAVLGNCFNNRTISRRWILSDACGNVDTIRQSIAIQDNEKPQFNINPVDTTVQCNSIPSPQSVLVTDNCSNNITPIFTETRTNGGCLDSYMLERKWTATDECGNTNSISQNIIVIDTIAPVFSGQPKEIFASCDNVPNPVNPIATDNCDVSLILGFSETTIGIVGNCLDQYQLIRTWTTSDNCGNQATFIQNVFVTDDAAPTLAGVPPNITISCTEVPDTALVTATDNCDPNVLVQVTDNFQMMGCPVTGELTRTWTAADRCGNTVSAVQIINIGNSISPTFSGVPNDLTVSCESIPDMAVVTAMGACGTTASVDTSETRIGEDCDYMLVRVWTAVDECGNQNTATQTISVTDLIAPTFSNFPVDVTINCNDPRPMNIPGFSDNCAMLEMDDLMYEEEEIDGTDDCEGSFIYARIWSIEDNCGNIATDTQLVTLIDTIPPVLSNVPMNLNVSCENQNDDFGMPNFVDACDDDAQISLVETKTIVCPGTFVLTRTWTAVDDCGNESTATQVVNVTDNVPPVFSMDPMDVSVSCDAIPNALILTATDNCGPDPVVTFTEEKVDGNCSGNYNIVRTWTAIDHCSNIATKTQTITVTDQEAPVFINFPDNFEVSCATDPRIDQVVITANDNCDNDVTISLVETIQDSTCINQFTLVRVYTITDDCGNALSDTLMITVKDDLIPEFPMIQADISVSCENIPDPTLIFATDNCLEPIDLDYSEIILAGNCENRKTLFRKWIATDACGNVDSLKQTIHVLDDKPPVFTPDSLPNYELSCEEAIPPVPVVTAIDNCGIKDTIDYYDDIEVDPSTTSGCEPYTYKIRRTWFVGDLCSNSATLQQVISVADTTAPTFVSMISDVTVSCDSIPTIDTIQILDNCDPMPTIIAVDDRTDGTCRNDYILNRTITISDQCGNTKVENQMITVFDNVAPTIVCPGDITVQIDNTVDTGDEDFVCEIQVDILLPVVADNCDGGLIIENDFVSSVDGNASGMYPIGVTVVTFTVADSCGNKATCEMSVTVKDKVPPEIKCNGLSSELSINSLAENSVTVFINEFMPTADDCQDFDMYFLPNQTNSITFDCFDVGDTIKVEAIAVDISGNETGCFNNIIIIDSEGSCPTPGDGISGIVATENDDPISNVNIIVNEQPVGTTSESGNYTIEEVVIGSSYEINPSFNMVERQKITTLDLLRLGRHIVGIQPLNSPYKLIAADVDYSNVIDVFDLVELQKLIIFNIDEYSQGNAWRFVDQQYNFIDEEAPLEEAFNESVIVENYEGSAESYNFVAVQLGNLNESSEEDAVLLEKSIWNWRIPAINIRKSEKVVIPIFADFYPTFDAFQVNWKFNSKEMQVSEILPGQVNPIFNVKDDNLLLSAIVNSPITIDQNVPLFSIVVSTTLNTESDHLFEASKEYLASYAVANSAIANQIGLDVEPLTEILVQDNKDLPVLFSNRPNPFKERTTLRFNMPSEGDLTIQIVDVAGHTLYRQNLFVKAGYQEVVVKRDQLNAEGVLFCQLITAKGTVTQKLLLLNQ